MSSQDGLTRAECNPDGASLGVFFGLQPVVFKNSILDNGDTQYLVTLIGITKDEF